MELIKVTRDGRGVAVLTLARAEKHNALSAQMMTELEAAAKGLAREDDVRVVVLAAEGRSFCAGGDLAWMRAQFGMDAAPRKAESRRIATRESRLADACALKESGSAPEELIVTWSLTAR